MGYYVNSPLWEILLLKFEEMEGGRDLKSEQNPEWAKKTYSEESFILGNSKADYMRDGLFSGGD